MTPPDKDPSQGQQLSAINFEKDKVGMFWEYKRGILFTFLGFVVSAFFAVVFNADRFAPGLWSLLVIAVAVTLLSLVILDIWRRLQLLAGQVTGYMTQVENGVKLGRFDQMIGLPDVPRRAEKLITAPSRGTLEVKQKLYSLMNSTRTSLRSLPSIEDISFEGVERLGQNIILIHVRNPGQKEVRINRYSINKGEPIPLAPPTVIPPRTAGTVTVSRDLGSQTAFVAGENYTVTVWTERGWSFSFTFKCPE